MSSRLLAQEAEVESGVPRSPVGEWIESGFDWVEENLGDFFDAISSGVEFLVTELTELLQSPHALILVAVFAAIAWLVKNWKLALVSALSLLLVVSMDQWDNAMQTLSLVTVAAAAALLIGIPLGVFSAVRQYSFFDYFFTAFSFIGISIPSFWFGLLIISVSLIAKKNGWFYFPAGDILAIRDYKVPGLGTVHPPRRRALLVRPAGAEPSAADVQHPADESLAHHGLEPLHRGGEPPVEAGHGDAPGARGGVDHGERLGLRHRHGLLAEDVRAAGDGGQRDVVVQMGRRGDDDDVGPRAVERLLPAREDLRHAVGVGDLPRRRLVALAERHHAAAVGLEGGDVGPAEAEPDDGDGGSGHGASLLSQPRSSQPTRPATRTTSIGGAQRAARTRAAPSASATVSASWSAERASV